MLLRLRIGSLGIACFLLAACSGGGGGPTQSSTPAPTASPSPVPTGTPGPATINVTGSTNTEPYTIVVNFNDSVSVTKGGSTTAGTATASTVSQLFADILMYAPLSQVAGNTTCTKPSSFSTVTTLTYNGATNTGDLSCPPSTTSPAQTLYTDVEAITTQFGPYND